MTFQAGQSGNPAGMKVGSKHKATRLVAQLATKAAGPIARDIIKRAKEGDPFCQSLYVRHILPRAKVNLAPIELPAPTSTSEATMRLAEIAACSAPSADLQLPPSVFARPVNRILTRRGAL
jgi:hypothetical protein